VPRRRSLFPPPSQSTLTSPPTEDKEYVRSIKQTSEEKRQTTPKSDPPTTSYTIYGPQTLLSNPS
jgi:hypothetical protein